MPVTKASSPTAGTGLPIKWYWSGLLGRTSSVTVILKCLSPIRSQYVTFLLVVAPPISPSVTERFSTGSSRCSEAFSIRARRAFAEAWRSAMPLLSKELLPAVYPSLGELSVSAVRTVIRPGSTSSSSATITVNAVVSFWPNSTLPVETVIRPSLWNCSQESKSGLLPKLDERVISLSPWLPASPL